MVWSRIQAASRAALHGGTSWFAAGLLLAIAAAGCGGKVGSPSADGGPKTTPPDARDDADEPWDGGEPIDASILPPDGGAPMAGHPRLWLGAAGWSDLAEQVSAHPELAALETQLRAEADRLLEEDTPLFNCSIPAGNIGRVILDRVYLFGYLARRLPGGARDPYRDRAKAELLAAVDEVKTTTTCFTWPSNADLVKAEYAHAVAIGYDWLFHDLSAPEREAVAALLAQFVNHARLRLGSTGKKPFWWTTTNSNWNLVCNGGFALAAMALLDDAGPAAYLESLDALNRIFVSFDAGGGSMRYGLAAYAPKGDWFEGPGYWHYATRYAVPAIATVRTALGNDAVHDALLASPGFATSVAYRLHARGPAGTAFNTSDAADNFTFVSDGDYFLGYLARGLSGDAAARARRLAWQDLLDEVATADSLRLRYVAAVSHLLAFSGTGGTPPDDVTVRQFTEVAFQRSAWAEDASWVALLAGSNLPQTHEQLDVGSFAFHADGEAWIEELGSDNYALASYFSNTFTPAYYRRITKGHNTLRFGGKEQSVAPNAKAAFVGGAASGPGVSFVRMQMKSAYANAGVTSALRGAALIGQPRELMLLADDVERAAGSASTAMEWQAHTRATKRTLLDGGRVLELEADGKRVRLYLLEPAGAAFVVSATDPVVTDPAGQKEYSRSAWRRITVTQNITTTGRVRVLAVPSGAAAFGKSIAQMAECVGAQPNCLSTNAEAVLTGDVADWALGG